MRTAEEICAELILCDEDEYDHIISGLDSWRREILTEAAERNCKVCRNHEEFPECKELCPNRRAVMGEEVEG